MKVQGTESQLGLAEAALTPTATTAPAPEAVLTTPAASVQISPEAQQAYHKLQDHPISGVWHGPGRKHEPSHTTPTPPTVMPTDPTGSGPGTIHPPLMPTDPTGGSLGQSHPPLMPTDPTGTGSPGTIGYPIIMPTDPKGKDPSGPHDNLAFPIGSGGLSVL